MNKTFTPVTSKKTTPEEIVATIERPAPAALSFIRQFARAYHVEPDKGMMAPVFYGIVLN